MEIDRDINNPQNITEIILQIEQSGRRKRNGKHITKPRKKTNNTFLIYSSLEKDFTPLFSRTDIQVNQIELEKSPPKPPKSTEYVYKERTAERTFKKRSRTPSPPRRRRSVSHDDSREKYYRKRSRSPETFRRRRSRSKSYDFKRSDSRDRKYVRERSRTPPRDYVEYRRRSRSRTRSKERYLKRKSPSPCSSRSRRHSRSPRRRSPSPYKRRSSPHRSQRRSRTKSPPKSDSGKREQPYMYPVPFYEVCVEANQSFNVFNDCFFRAAVIGYRHQCNICNIFQDRWQGLVLCLGRILLRVIL